MEKSKINLTISRFVKNKEGDVMNLFGYENGKYEAERLNLIENIKNYDILVIEFPSEIISISPSYVKGLLEGICNDIGKDDFERKIHFSGGIYVIRWLGIGLRNLLRT